MYSRSTYRLTPELHIDYPKAVDMLSKGHLYDMSSNIFKLLPQVFFDKIPKDGNEYDFNTIVDRYTEIYARFSGDTAVLIS